MQTFASMEQMRRKRSIEMIAKGQLFFATRQAKI
jgi:hypothetical protein